MTSRIYSAPISPKYNRLLPSLDGAAEWAIWLQPEGWRYAGNDIASLVHAFEPLRAVVWLASDSGARTPRIRDHLRALGDYRSLVKSLVAKTTVQYLDSAGVIYSDVAWLSSDSSGDLANLLSRSTAGCDSSLAFIPKNGPPTQKWVDIVSGLNWLWLCRNWVATSPQPLIDADAVVLSYVRLTIDIGGAAGLMWEDTDARKGLVFFGTESVLKPPASRLAAHCQILDAAAFEHWFDRGVALRASR